MDNSKCHCFSALAFVYSVTTLLVHCRLPFSKNKQNIIVKSSKESIMGEEFYDWDHNGIDIPSSNITTHISLI